VAVLVGKEPHPSQPAPKKPHMAAPRSAAAPNETFTILPPRTRRLPGSSRRTKFAEHVERHAGEDFRKFDTRGLGAVPRDILA
jgi:hypothetical protein